MYYSETIYNQLKNKLWLLPALLLATGAAAQPRDTVRQIPVSLAEIWQQAATNNKSVKMQQLRVKTSEEELKDIAAERLPEINAAGEYARVSNVPIYENGLFNGPTSHYPVLHTYYKAGGEAYLNLYSGNKTNIKQAEQKTIRSLREEQTSMTIADAKLQATAYYLDMQRSIIFHNLMEQNIADRQKQLQHMRQLQQNGVILKSDVLRAALQLSRQELALVQIDNDLAIARQKLNIVTGMPDTLPVVPLAATLPDSVLLPFDAYLAQAADHAHPYRVSEQVSALRKLQVKEVKAGYMPKLGLFANYTYAYPQIFLYPYSAGLYGFGMAGVKASLPISGLYQNRHKVKVAELEYATQELEHADVEDQVRQKVKETWLRYKEALNRISVANTNIQQAKENARIVHNTYFNQLSLITDLLDADTQLLQTQFDLAAAQIAAHMQYYQLQNAIGNL